VDLGVVIQPGQSFKIGRTLQGRKPGHVEQIINGERTVWLYGFIAFLDFLNVERKSGFCARLQISSPTFMLGDMELRSGIFVQDGPPEYTYNI